MLKLIQHPDTMSTHCLAIGTRPDNLQKLLKVFQYFDDSFHLSSVNRDMDALRKNPEDPPFSLFFVDSSPNDNIASEDLRLYLRRKNPRTPILLIKDELIQRNHPVLKTSQITRIISAPITPVSLAGTILSVLKRKYHQGQMPGISFSFSSTLQLIEMDKLTCTLAITHNNTHDTGWIFFKNGIPINAGFGMLAGVAAIKKILPLGELGVTMYGACPLRENRLNMNCSKLVLDMKEAQHSQRNVVGKSFNCQLKPKPTGLASLFMQVKKNRC